MKAETLKYSASTFAKEAQKYNIEKSELSQLKKTCQKLGDKEGMLDLEGFTKLMNTLFEDAEKSTVDYERLFVHIDADANGMVDVKEFIVWLSVYVKGEEKDKLEAIFSALDADGSGALEDNEITELLDILKFSFSDGIGLEDSEAVRQAAALVKQLDSDKDGKITLEEWVTIGTETKLVEYMLGRDFLQVLESYNVPKGKKCLLM